MAYQSEIEKLEQRYREKPEQWFAALADAYRKAGEVERAVDIVRAGLEKRPNYTSGHIVLGRCLLDQLADEEAVAAFERVLELDAENIIALKSLSEIAERKSDLTGACRWLERLLDVDPMNEEAREALKALRQGGADPLERTDKRVAIDLGSAREPESDTMDDIVRESEFPVGEGDLGAGEEPSGWDEIGTGPAHVERVVTDQPFGFGDLPAPAPPDDEPTAPPMEAEAPSLEAEPPSLEPAGPPPGEAAPTQDEEGSIHAVTLPQAVRPEDLIRDLVLERASESETGTTMADDVRAPAEDESEGPTLEMPPVVPPSGLTPVSVPPPEDADVAPEEWVDVDAAADMSAAAESEDVLGTSDVSSAPADPGVRPFDEELAWDAGERQSGDITSEVIEEAHRTHEEALEPAAHYLPGLEGADIPEVGADAANDAERDAEDEEPFRLSSELPLIMPEDLDPAPVEPDDDDEDESGPDPVVTETMAEVYARQGLFGEASEIYRQLLSRRPGDPTLERRLAELAAKTATPAAAAREPRDVRFAAARTGGLSVRLLFHEIVTGEPPPAGAGAGVAWERDAAAADPFPPGATTPRAEPSSARPAAPRSAEPIEAPRPPEPPPSTAFHDAFGGDDEPEPARDASGNPAQLAGDEVSLASVFGEEPAPRRRPPGDAGEHPPASRAGSYDDFFGGDDQDSPPPTSRDGEGKHDGDDGDSEFRAWLEGLKT